MSPNAFPKTSVESAVGERAIFCGYLFPKRFGEGGAGELTIVERAACERGAVEYAVGEVATLEGDVNEKRTGEVAAKELAIGEAAARNLKLDEARFCSMEPAEFDGLRAFRGRDRRERSREAHRERQLCEVRLACKAMMPGRRQPVLNWE